VSGFCGDGAAVVLDVKGLFSPDDAEKQGIFYWRL
jgi:hypothetical protein